MVIFQCCSKPTQLANNYRYFASSSRVSPFQIACYLRCRTTSQIPFSLALSLLWKYVVAIVQSFLYFPKSYAAPTPGKPAAWIPFYPKRNNDCCSQCLPSFLHSWKLYLDLFSPTSSGHFFGITNYYNPQRLHSSRLRLVPSIYGLQTFELHGNLFNWRPRQLLQAPKPLKVFYHVIEFTIIYRIQLTFATSKVALTNAFNSYISSFYTVSKA